MNEIVGNIHSHDSSNLELGNNQQFFSLYFIVDDEDYIKMA